MEKVDGQTAPNSVGKPFSKRRTFGNLFLRRTDCRHQPDGVFTVPYMLMKQERADFSVAVLAAFLEQKKVLKRAQTYAFTVLGMSQLFHAVGMRDVRQSIFRAGRLKTG